MKKVIIILSAIALIASGCGQVKSKQTETTNNKEVVSEQEFIEQELIQDNSSSSITYIYENDSLKQTVTVDYINKSAITFKLTSYNRRVNQTAMIEGTAKDKSSGLATEIDEDENGNTYPVMEYIYSGDCWLSFRVDVETQTTIRVTLADCEDNPYCPFTSMGILKKQ
jgi:hypothetical protein